MWLNWLDLNEYRIGWPTDKGSSYFYREVKKRFDEIKAQDDVIDNLNSEVRLRLIELMKKKPLEIERSTYLLWVAHNLERIADRGVNIAERSMFLVGN